MKMGAKAATRMLPKRRRLESDWERMAARFQVFFSCYRNVGALCFSFLSHFFHMCMLC